MFRLTEPSSVKEETAKHTWISPDGKTRNQIDYILVNQRFKNSVKNCKSRPGAYCGSDHNPVTIKIQIKLKKIKKTRSVRKRWNVQELKKEDKRKEFAIESERKLEELQKSYKEANKNTNTKWKQIKECISEIAENSVGRITPEKKQVWMTKEILEKMKKRKDSRNKGKQTEVNKWNKEIKKDCRKAKEDYYSEKCQELERLDAMHSPNLYKKIKEFKPKKMRIKIGIRNKEGKLLNEEAEINKRWEEYIGTELYNDDRPEKEEEKGIKEMKNYITDEELIETINKLPKNKAEGCDNIPAEFYQSLNAKGTQIILQLINDIYETGNLPDDFVNIIFIPIPKVNKAKDCSDFRTISLISHAAKILLYIIKNRITPIIETCLILMTESQEDLQMMVNKLCEKCKEYGMALNAKKTKVMLVSKNKCNDQINIYADRDKLEEVNGYKYLGQWITSDGKCIKEVKRRIGRAKGEFWVLKELFRKDLNIKVKKKILHTYIFSIVSYGADSWTVSKEVIRRIRAFEGWCHRRVLKISWKDHATNEMVEEKMGCKRELVTGIGQRKMRFAGHVLRGSSGELANLVLEGTIDGKRDRGKQRKTWSDDVKNWSRTGNLGNAKRKAEDKSLWHSIVVNLRIEDDT
ncbi:LINE-1 retrotransposable element ORF2 protein [Nymphon striatum]|nr:LINE-1 retrotransposable element ORF2 protein [Nymphon striatum]